MCLHICPVVLGLIAIAFSVFYGFKASDIFAVDHANKLEPRTPTQRWQMPILGDPTATNNGNPDRRRHSGICVQYSRPILIRAHGCCARNVSLSTSCGVSRALLSDMIASKKPPRAV